MNWYKVLFFFKLSERKTHIWMVSFLHERMQCESSRFSVGWLHKWHLKGLFLSWTDTIAVLSFFSISVIFWRFQLIVEFYFNGIKNRYSWLFKKAIWKLTKQQQINCWIFDLKRRNNNWQSRKTRLKRVLKTTVVTNITFECVLYN